MSDHAIVSADDGNDYIGNIASNVTIMGGNDDDTVLSDPNIVLVNIQGGDGEDSITNLSNWTTIDGGDDSDYIVNYASNVTMDGGSGDDTIHPYGDNQTIVYYNNQGDDYIYGSNNNLTVYIPNASIADIQSIIYNKITFNSASSIYVGFGSGLSNVNTFKFSDNKEYKYDSSSGSFVEK